ncbi:MAG: hypothetical protein IT453_09800 [Planctomycetes bacterium]|nr:hypothetical protein [Planctomycetota bacterium]
MKLTRARHLVLSLSAASILANAAFAQWTNDPAVNLQVGVAANDQAVPKVAATADGKTWFGWFDNRSGTYAVYVQCVDAQGNALFAPNGLLVSSNPQSTSLVDWDLVTDAQGNALLAFTDTRAGSDLDVYAYKITQAGAFAWGANGVVVSSNNDFEASPQCAALTDGSLAVVWGRSPSGADGTVRIQRLDANGVAQYAANGLAISGAAGEDPGFPQVVAAESGKYIVTWLRDIGTFASPRHMRAQKFDAAGNAQWGAAPVSVLDNASLSIAYWPDVHADGAGGIVFGWHVSVGSDFNAYVQKLDANGVEAFAHNGLRIANAASVLELYPSVAPLGAGGDLMVAFERRNTTQSQWGVNVQRVSAAGALVFGTDGVVLEPIDGKNESFVRALPFGDGAMVFCFDEPTGSVIQDRVVAWRLDGAGNSLWGGVATPLSTDLHAKDDLEVVIDSTGIARAGWHDERNDSGDIYTQNIDVDGTLGNGSPCEWSNYCVTSPNSVGPGALISASGSTSVALNSLVLKAAGCPLNKSCLFFYGPNATAGVPFKNGVLCISGGFYRLPVTNTGASGNPSAVLDITNPPAIGGQITAGSIWRFQLWYRDPIAPPAGANLSDALSVTFCQ